ncbi:hypothetical protein K492DRAFT_183952 [Lichtheimia hyalospora FSU 10163]|nr:hypothetical protein K492DRAFT_183952 [Lichtheimia hyalospora FSU 10163]
MSMKIADILNPAPTSSSLDPSSRSPMEYNNNSSSQSLDLLCDSATASSQYHVLSSPPLSPHRYCHYPRHHHPDIVDVESSSGSNSSYGKPRNRFSEYEDAVICEGVAKGLTWGQISGKLPHRKRATCFNRYRTLQGIRKSRSGSMTASHPYEWMMSNQSYRQEWMDEQQSSGSSRYAGRRGYY